MGDVLMNEFTFYIQFKILREAVKLFDISHAKQTLLSFSLTFFRDTFIFGIRSFDFDIRNLYSVSPPDVRVTTSTALAVTSRTPGTTAYTTASNSTLEDLPSMSLTAEPLLPTTTCCKKHLTSSPFQIEHCYLFG